VHIHKAKNGVKVEIWHIEGEQPIAVVEALSADVDRVKVVRKVVSSKL
jgi:hypothetical protein